MALTMKVVENKPRVFVVTLAGSLDSTTYPALETKLASLIAEGAAKVLTLDLAALEFISSMGIRVLFKARKELARVGGSLCLARIPPPGETREMKPLSSVSRGDPLMLLTR